MAGRSFDWHQYYNLADELSKRPEESCLRTAIGRAYYYAFHLARKRIIDNRFFISPGADSHKQVWEKFEGSADHRRRSLGVLAKFLKEKRQRADYEPIYSRIEDDVPIVLERAKTFANDLAQLDYDLPRNTGVKV
jgi:uncharacterized protein (UPF0332 family)